MPPKTLLTAALPALGASRPGPPRAGSTSTCSRGGLAGMVPPPGFYLRTETYLSRARTGARGSSGLIIWRAE